ncbi:MAG: hypothetical protein E7I45_12595 [Eikenella corrodens]|uniref:hypothetical protein n=1 Tax=Eikenella corrodens TaxID=539 RepID=UPI00290DE5CB|nr:hypothetical protein [Eikenella corrodens]MDU4301788.1 hypothetical protein [Eikenella corrodens]
MTAHKHAALMLQYAQDAAETDRPWERWEWRDINTDQFITCNQHPSWSLNGGFRRKPQVIRVGRHEFPKPIAFTPPKDTIYWITRLSAEGYAPDDMIWTGDKTDFDLLKSCVVHLSREAAQAHADVLNAICRGDID